MIPLRWRPRALAVPFPVVSSGSPVPPRNVLSFSVLELDMNIRKTGGREELDALWGLVNGLVYRQWCAQNPGLIANGTTAGKLKTVTTTTTFKIDGVDYTKGATDDLWDLSAEVDTTSAQYRAYWLYLDDAGVATIAAGENSVNGELALKALPDLDPTRSIIGIYVAGPSTDFNGVAGLDSYGDIYDRVPSGVPDAPLSPNLAHLVAP